MTYDIFISYATDDWESVSAIRDTLERAGLNVYLDVPLDPDQSPVEVLLQGIARQITLARRRPVQSDTTRRSDTEILRELRTRLSDSQTLLVLWSRSHRGSRWARHEIDIFEREHADRPIFVIRADSTSWAQPTTQWVPIGDASAITRERLISAVRDLNVEIVGEAPRLLDVILRPSHWTTAVQRWRWDTTSVQLMALAGIAKPDDRGAATTGPGAGVLRSAGVAALLVIAVVTVLTLGGLATAAHLSPVSQAPRHVVLTAMSLVTFVLLLSVQTELAVLVAATVPAGGIALAAQLLWSWWIAPNGGAGPGAGAVLGAVGGGVLLHSWQQRRDADESSISRSRLTASVLIAVALVVAFVVAVVPGQPANGQVHSSALVAAIAGALLLPVLALWREVSRTGRAREVLIRGSASSGLIFVSILAMVWLFDRAVVRLDQQALGGGAIGGLVVGLCAGAIALTPGALFGDRVDRHSRVIATIAAISLALLTLYPLLVLAGAPADFVQDTAFAIGAYTAALSVSLGVAAIWIGVRRTITDG